MTPEEQNLLLRDMVRDLTTVLQEVLAVLPPEYHELSNVRHAVALATKIQFALEMERRSKLQ